MVKVTLNITPGSYPRVKDVIEKGANNLHGNYAFFETVGNSRDLFLLCHGIIDENENFLLINDVLYSPQEVLYISRKLLEEKGKNCLRICCCHGGIVLNEVICLELNDRVYYADCLTQTSERVIARKDDNSFTLTLYESDK